MLGRLGSQVAEEPFVSHSQYATFIYFFYLLFLLPFWARVENDVYYEMKLEAIKIYETRLLRKTANATSIIPNAGS